tara:strand:+ start:32517 stop:33122 length:606 start_codon:yes stop_codon:yes gene_type:complete
MKIGLVPVSAKPYHAGHHALVVKAAEENDQVILYVSISDRKRKGQLPILGSAMEQVWKEELEPIMPSNVSIEYGGSPVRKVYSALERANEALGDDVYRVYSDPEDTALNYPTSNRLRYFPDLYESGKVIFVAEDDPDSVTRGVGTPDISGTAMRHALEICDLDTFQKGMPAGVDVKNVRDILCPGMQENMLRTYVRQIIMG